LLYHTALQPTELKKGDYFPFLLMSDAGDVVKAVFPKADGQVRVILLRLSEKGWTIEGTQDIK